MDSATIAVLFMTAIVVGALVWLNIHSRRSGGASDESQERPATERLDDSTPSVQPAQSKKRRKRR